MSGIKRTYKANTYQTLPAWGTAEIPPTEFLLFPYGPTQATMFGGKRETVFLTPDNAKAIVDEWSRRGIRGHFDYDHAITQNNPEGTPSAGAFDLELRADGIWVVNIEWTPKMLGYFKNKEYQYTSPFFETELGSDNKQYVKAIYNVAVTNWPATDQLKPLIALSRKKLKAYGAPMDPKAQEAIKAILDALIKEGDEANTAQAILDIQAALSGAANPNEAPADPDMPAMSEIAATARKLTGKSTAAEVKGALQAAFNAKTEVSTLNERIKALETKEAKDLIERSNLTPASKGWALSQLSQPNGCETVKSFIEASAKDAPVGPKLTLVEPPVTSPESDEPSKEVVAFCQSKGLDAKIYLKNWKLLNPKNKWSKELA